MMYSRMLVDDTSTKESVGAKMNEFGIKCGSSRMGCLSGQIQCVYSQRVTGTVGIYTLQHFSCWWEAWSSYELARGTQI